MPNQILECRVQVELELSGADLDASEWAHEQLERVARRVLEDYAGFVLTEDAISFRTTIAGGRAKIEGVARVAGHARGAHGGEFGEVSSRFSSRFSRDAFESKISKLNDVCSIDEARVLRRFQTHLNRHQIGQALGADSVVAHAPHARRLGFPLRGLLRTRGGERPRRAQVARARAPRPPDLRSPSPPRVSEGWLAERAVPSLRRFRVVGNATETAS